MDSMTPTATATAQLQANMAAVAAASGANAVGALPASAAAAGGGAAALPNADSHANKNAPHLHSVASSLRSCLDGMLPDTLRNDAAAFHQHLDQQKNRIQTEKNSWRFGLNYLFETLKQHKDWYARNQQFVQLKKDVKRFETHVSTIRSILSESVSKLDLEAGLRVAELEGRVGAYKIMFEVTKIVTKLSRPLVKLQILKPDESSMSIYCDTFVLDIVLVGGEGAVESASLTTVEKDQTKQFPERDEDLLRSLKLLAAGKSSNFTEKLIRLINRAELAVKYPSINFEQLEEDLYLKISEACSQQTCWTAKRAVEGITIHFKDPLNCAPISEPPRKKMKIEDAQAGAGAGAAAAVATAVSDLSSSAAKAPATGGGGDREHGANDDESSPKDVESVTPLANGEWSGSVSFFEWRGEVALHVAGYSPIVMVGVQARRLSQCAMRPHAEGAAATPIDPQEEEKCFNEFVTWSLPDGTKPIAPQLHFARDHSVCSVMPVQSTLGMRQEYSLTTKEISGGLRLASFPIPLTNASTDTFSSVLQICGHSLFFHSVLLSAFTSKSNIFGRRIPADSEDAVNALIKVDVAAPERITLHTGELLGPGKQVLLEIGTKMDCSLEMSMKFLATTPRANGAAGDVVELEDTATMQKLSSACHSVPLLTYYALKRALQTKNGQSTARTTTSTANGADCNGIVALDDDLNGTMKLEGEEDMLLDDMGLF
uniref:Mediator of RNA polymerase II transcription subunit 1 n=1 Tax=Globisporangium ultimum (strain ATCC 200006 / CBS 805.95 / DAOM BR144) TaxID=431595 RepID=K3WHL4_GLOUD